MNRLYIYIMFLANLFNLIGSQSKILSKRSRLKHGILSKIVQFALNRFAVNWQYASEVGKAYGVLSGIILKKSI